MEEIHTDQCLSFRNKYSNERCPNRRKSGSEYCGIHLRSKNIRRYNLDEECKIVIKKKKIDNHTSKILNITELFDLYQKLPDIDPSSKSDVEYSCKYFNVKYSKVRIERSLHQLIEKLNFYLNLENNHLDKIINVQKNIRGWLIRKRKRAVNIEDCGTLEPIISIPHQFFIDFFDTDTKLYYGFDIRTLKKLLEKGVNPYNTKPFPKNDEKFMNIYAKKIAHLNKQNISKEFEKVELSEEQKYKQRIVDVFQQYDLLGQYTDVKWFEDLEFHDLIRLYKGAYDLFDYRAQLTHEMKKRIVKSGVAFRRLIHDIDYLTLQNMRFLQYEILNEFERFVNEAEDIENKKLGSNLMLTALVEVNQEAAIALPHLVQSTFEND